MHSSALRKFTFTDLSSQTSAIPQLIFGCSCFLGVVSSDVFNRGGQVCLACISDMKAGIRFFPFLFSFFTLPLHAFVLFADLFSPFSCMFSSSDFLFMLALDLDFLWLHFTRFHWLCCVKFLWLSFAFCRLY